jgi:PKHD-type hydroxylase
MSLWPAFFYCQIRGGLLTPSECNDVLAMHARYPTASGHLPTARECTLYWIYRDPDSDWLFERIGNAVEEWNRNWQFDVDIGAETGLQLSRYRPGERYDWHMDTGAGECGRRKISVLIELCEPQEHGGGFEVFYGDNRDNRIRLARGDAAIFPSFVMHRAVTPAHGERWTIAAWIKGAEHFR